jgi:phosphate transport system substrate-binding protein
MRVKFYNYTAVLLVLAVFASFSSCKEKASKENGLHGEISISGAFALYPMVIKWSEEFGKLHPGVKFDIQAGGAGKGMTDALTGNVELGMVSREITPEEVKKGAFGVAVAKDAVIPTISASNPYLNVLNEKGATRQKLRDIWITGKIKNWNGLTGTGDLPLRVYTRSDAAGAPETWAKYLGGNQEELLGTGVFGDPGLAEAVMNEKTAIGFNNINYVYNLSTGKPHPGISPLPIDLNGNGTLDADEKIYATLQDINKAIATNKFPSPPARPLYLVLNGKPKEGPAREFLRWILTDGQKYVKETGYVNLPENMLQEEMDKLKN